MNIEKIKRLINTNFTNKVKDCKGNDGTRAKTLLCQNQITRLLQTGRGIVAKLEAPKGYYVEKDSIEKGIVSPEYYGWGYYRYRLIELDNIQERTKKKRKRGNKCVT